MIVWGAVWITNYCSNNSSQTIKKELKNCTKITSDVESFYFSLSLFYVFQVFWPVAWKDVQEQSCFWMDFWAIGKHIHIFFVKLALHLFLVASSVSPAPPSLHHMDHHGDDPLSSTSSLSLIKYSNNNKIRKPQIAGETQKFANKPLPYFEIYF